MTLFAWYGPWAWPAWPAFAVLHLLGESYGDLSHAARGAVLVVLIVINTAFWGLITYVLMRAVSGRLIPDA